jgi:hypothetical protein
LLIGRLGVDQRVAGHGFGIAQLARVLGKAVEVNYGPIVAASPVDDTAATALTSTKTTKADGAPACAKSSTATGHAGRSGSSAN